MGIHRSPLTIGLYEQKLEELESVLMSMGKDPTSVAEWVFSEVKEGHLKLGQVQSIGAQSVALIKSLPKATKTAILGVRLTEANRAQTALEVIRRDETRISEEMNDIMRMQRGVRNLIVDVNARRRAVLLASERLEDEYRFGKEGSRAAYQKCHMLQSQVIPILTRLETELESALFFLEREYLSRRDVIDQLNFRQLFIPKYNKKARAKRKRRHAARVAQQKKEQDSHDEAKD